MRLEETSQQAHKPRCRVKLHLPLIEWERSKLPWTRRNIQHNRLLTAGRRCEGYTSGGVIDSLDSLDLIPQQPEGFCRGGHRRATKFTQPRFTRMPAQNGPAL